jgi:hypothetical protein
MKYFSLIFIPILIFAFCIYFGAYNLVRDFRPPHYPYKQIDRKKLKFKYIFIFPGEFTTVHLVAVIEQAYIFIVSILQLIAYIIVEIFILPSYVRDGISYYQGYVLSATYHGYSNNTIHSH